MKLKSALTIFLVFLYLSGFSYGMTKRVRIESPEGRWEQVPLRSKAQKEPGSFGGEGMQMIYSIAYAPSNPDVVYLVSNTSQVWKSTDGGTNWTMKHRGFLSNGGISVNVDPVNENIVFVSGSLCKPKKPYMSSPADGIYRTEDGGETWSLVKKTPFFGEAIEGQHFAFEQPEEGSGRSRIIYAGTHKDGLLISEDSGHNWRSLGFKGERIIDVEFSHTDPSALYILTRTGLFNVKIDHYNISQIKRIGQYLPGSIKSFALAPQIPGTIYAAMGKEGIYKSTDNGARFLSVIRGLPGNLAFNYIAVSPANSNYIYASVHKWGGLNPFWSHDSGNSWHQTGTLDMNNDSITKGRFFSAPISPHPFDHNMALTSTNGIARIIKTSDGGLNWFYSGNGYTGGRKGEGIASQAFHPDPRRMIFFLMDFGPALTTDGGETFRLLNIPRLHGAKTTRVGAVSPNDNNLIVTAVGKWGIQSLIVSTDGGENWKIIEGTDDRYKFIAFHPQKPNIIYAYGFKSNDSGMTWRKLPQKVYGMFRGNGDMIYSVKDIEGGRSVIIRSDDQGETWMTPYASLPFEAANISEIDIDPLNPNHIYVASFSGLYTFDDRNGKWDKKGEESGLNKDRFGLLSVKNVAVDPRHPEVVYVGKVALGKGHSNGIFRSTDYGKTWKNITYNLGPEFTASSISVSPHDGIVFIGSSHGTWKLPPPY